MPVLELADVHAALERGDPRFVLLDVRRPAALPHQRAQSRRVCA
jgi:hypothetical protein